MARPAARLESVAWVLPTQVRSRATDMKLCVAKKRPKYRGATPVVVPRGSSKLMVVVSSPLQNNGLKIERVEARN